MPDKIKTNRGLTASFILVWHTAAVALIFNLVRPLLSLLF